MADFFVTRRHRSLKTTIPPRTLKSSHFLAPELDVSSNPAPFIRMHD